MKCLKDLLPHSMRLCMLRSHKRLGRERERELGVVVMSMAKGKAPRHDGMPVEFFQKLWPSLGDGFHKMILKGIEQKSFHVGITRGVVSLIIKEGELRDLNF